MTLLTVVQQFCQINALNIPNFVVSNGDTNVLQMLGICNEMLDEIVDTNKWQAFTQEGHFTMIAAESQGSVKTLAPNGFLWFNFETFYDRTLRRPLYGPVDDQEWQAIKAIPNPGPYYKFRIRGDQFLINPAPTVAPFSVIYFEYASSFGVTSGTGVAKALFTADDDQFNLDDKILRKGLGFRYKQLKGLPYQADEVSYYSLLNSAIAKKTPRRAYNLGSGENFTIQPGIFVPSGNWPVVN